MDQNGRDVNSYLLKHYMEKAHQCLQNKDFAVVLKLRKFKIKN